MLVGIRTADVSDNIVIGRFQNIAITVINTLNYGISAHIAIDASVVRIDVYLVHLFIIHSDSFMHRNRRPNLSGCFERGSRRCKPCDPAQSVGYKQLRCVCQPPTTHSKCLNLTILIKYLSLLIAIREQATDR